MRKTKILAVFGILLAMGITACNKSSTNKSSSSEEHKHSFGSWTEVTPATCTQDGVKERVCECGEKETGTLTKLGHDFKNGTVVGDTSTCTANGKQTVKCARCDATQESDIKAHHRFGVETAVAAAAEGYVGYKTAECSVDHVKQIKIRALDGKLASGSTIKSGTPDGFMKLTNNGHEISWKFNVAGEKGLSGKLYQIGAMDAFSSNTTKTYAHTSSSSSTTVEKTEGNFRVTVNGTKIDKSAMIDVTFEAMTAGGEDSSALGDDYSPIALCEIGPCLLNPGDNTIVYRRIGSYNLVVSDLVFIGEEFTHQHQAADTWSKDANGHWHACVAAGCPQANYKLDEAEHTWAADWAPVEGHEATCEAEGQESRTCSVCGYVATRDTAKLPHDFLELKKFDADDEKGTIAATAYDCTVCQATVLEWSALDFDESSLVTEVVQENGVDVGVKMKTADKCDPTSSSAGGPCNPETVGTKYVYKLDIYEAVTDAVLSFKIKPYNSYGNPHIFATESGDYCPGYVDDGNGGYKMADNRYGLIVNGQFVELGEDPYGTDSSLKGKVAWFDFQAKFNLTEGVNTIEILCLGGYPADAIYSYRLNNMPTIDVGHRHRAGAEWLSNETSHWHACVAEGCEAENLQMNKADHEFGEKYDVVDATCTAPGSYKEKCTVCQYEKTTVVPQLAHAYEDEPAEAYPAGEGYIATSVYNCTTCTQSALRWSALAYDTEKTTARSTSGPESRDSGKAIRFSSTPNYDGQNTSTKGCHIVYNVKVLSDVTNVGLAFLTSARADVATVFDRYDDDSSKGYEYVNEELVRPDSRYGLKIDGNVVILNKDTSGQTWNGKTWYQFPVTIASLSAGIHEIEIYNLGGFRVDMYEFQLTGLPHVEPSHRHTLSDNYSYDVINHWKTCVGEECPLDEGAHIGEENHTMVAGTAVQNSDGKDVAPISCACGISGYEMALADCAGADKIESDGKLGKGAEMTWKFKLAADGEGHYKVGKIAFVMCARLNGGTPYGQTAPADNAFADDYALAVGSKAGTVTCAGKQLGANFGATTDNPVYFQFGEITIEESDIVDGELAIKVTQAANQGYRHRYSGNVRILYIPAE